MLWKRRALVTERLMLPVVFTVVLFSLFTSAEYTSGLFYGNASKLAKQTMAFVCQDKAISQVITYNDIGGWELGECGKYFKRFYLNPAFSKMNETKFGTYQGYYVVVNMPPIDPSQKIARYFQQCKVAYEDRDKRVTAHVYDCRGVPYPANP